MIGKINLRPNKSVEDIYSSSDLPHFFEHGDKKNFFFKKMSIDTKTPLNLTTTPRPKMYKKIFYFLIFLFLISKNNKYY